MTRWKKSNSPALAAAKPSSSGRLSKVVKSFPKLPNMTDDDKARIRAQAAVFMVKTKGITDADVTKRARELMEEITPEEAFAMLRARHLAPERWLPRIKAPDVFRFAERLRSIPDARRAMLCMPPLLRTYLLMGAWVSDHAVVDRQMNTLHVFTGLEIGAIPASRKRLLRALV